MLQSRALRVVLVLALLGFAWMVLANWPNDTAQGRMIEIALAGLALVFAVGVAMPERAKWAVRVVAGAVAAFYVVYLAEQAWRLLHGEHQALRPGQPSAVMAALGLLVWGIPFAVYALSGRTLREHKAGAREDEVDDADFGRMTRSPVGWVGSTTFAGEDIALIIGSAGAPIEPALRAFAFAELARLTELDEIAREFVRKQQPDLKLEELGRVSFLYPPASWIRQLRQDGVAHADRLDPARPISSLCYAIAGDRNVIDVALDGVVAFETDYH